MSKNLYFLISFVLVLSLGGLAQAGTPIDVNNNSFEYDVNGNNIGCHTGLEIVLAWEQIGGDFAGVDVNCGWEDVNCDNCHEWVEYPNGTTNLYYQGSVSVYQILDHNIVYGHKYTMTVDLMAWDPMVLQLFALEDVCNPDVNHLLISSSTVTPDVWYNTDIDPARWMYEHDVEAIGVITDAAMVGKKLGIKFGGTNTDYRWVDNVRVEWTWASNAYDPAPSDGAEYVNSQALTLSWMPGLWAVNDVNGHEVYFGTSWAEVNDANTSSDPNIYRGTGVGVVSGPDGNDRYSYVIPGGDLPFALGETYFWRIDEVNDNYVGPVPPVNDRWKGEVWSFEVEGKAKVVYPADGAENIPALNLILRWEAGTGAGSHDVYFGSNQADVTDANTASDPNIFRGNQIDVNDPNYPVEDLEVGKPYFWRIDEVNTAAVTLVTGDVWAFTTGSFLLVDSFEWYKTHQEIRAVWKDYWSGSLGGKNGAVVKLMTEADDPNMILGGEGQSMEYYFRCYLKIGADYQGSMAEADTADLEIGSDWTVGGVKALVVNFYGDPCNLTDTYGPYQGINPDQMWVALSDDTNEGVVQYPKMGHIAEASWHEWNISLIDPNFSSVDMNNVAKVYIGFGGQKIGQNKAGAGMGTTEGDTVWFDEIRLYPPRCLPSATGLDVLSGLGDIGGGGEEGTDQDCNTDYLDLDIMARDWASIDGLAMTENRPAILTDFPDSTSHWTTDRAVGTGAIEVNAPHKIRVDDPRLFGLMSMSITAWVKQTIHNEWVGIVCSREKPCSGKGEATELGIYGGGFGGPGGKTAGALGYDWSCISDAWKFDAGLDVPEDGTWTFIAMSVDPTGCTLYMQPDGGAMDSDREIREHPPQQNFAEYFDIGLSKPPEEGHFVGKIDDVRIYGYNLDDANVLMLANKTGEPNPPPVYWYKFDETSGLSAADYGTSIEVYTMNMSPANVLPKDPCESEDPNLGSNAFDPNNLDIVNFRDYKFMAEHWLEQHPWP